MTTQVLRRNIRLLVINPNSSHEMTHGIERAIRSMDLPDVRAFPSHKYIYIFIQEVKEKRETSLQEPISH